MLKLEFAAYSNRQFFGLNLKHSWKYFTLFFLCAIIFSSCKEELMDPQPEQEIQAKKDTSVPTIPGDDGPGNDDRKLNCSLIKKRVINDKGILVFKDMQHFWDCVECLDRDYDTFNDNYDAKYPNATAEELDKLDESNRFDHWQPYIEFENSKAFNSLRADIEAAIFRWLDNTPADQINFDNDPDENTPIISETIRTLFNSRGFVSIDGKKMAHTYFGEQDTKLFDDCAFSKTTRAYYDSQNSNLPGNRRIKIKVGVRSGLFTSNTFAKGVHYKLKNNRWKRRRGRIAVSLAAQPSGGDCEDLAASDDWFKYKGFKNRRTRRATASIWFKWRENFARQSSNPGRWNNEAARGVCFYNNQNTILPVKLIKN